MLSDLFALRAGLPSDIDFVEASWIDTMRHGSPHSRGIPSEIFKPWQRARIRGLMARARLLVACNPDDTDVVIGYCVGEATEGGDAPRVHFVYVKERFRRVGVATALMAAMTSGKPFIATAYTDALWSIMHRHPSFPCTVNPFLPDSPGASGAAGHSPDSECSSSSTHAR